MIRRTPVFMATSPQLLGSGLQPDLHPLQRILWEKAENVSFVNGKVRRRRPEEFVITAGGYPIRGIAQLLDSSGVRWLWAASGGKLVRWYGPSVEQIATGLTWTEDEGSLYPATYWDFNPYGDWMIFNSGRGQAQVYKPSGPSIDDLGDVPSDVSVLLRKAAFIVALGYGGAKTRVGWSNGDIIDEWTAGTGSLAGSLTITEFNTPIRAAAPMGESIAVYAEDQMAMLNYVGTPFYFGYKMRLDGIGAVGKMAVASDGRINVGVGRNGVWWTDGSSFKYIDEGHLHQYLQDNVNWQQKSKIICCRNDITGCYDFSFPMRESLVQSEGWSYDPRVGCWYEIPSFSHKDERRLFNKVLSGSLDGDVYYDEAASNGRPLSLSTKPILGQLQDESGLRDVHNTVSMSEIDILLKTARGIEWRLGSCKEPNGEFTFGAWREALAGANTYPVARGLPSAPYHKLQFRSIVDDWDIDLQGFMFFGAIEGTKGASKS